MNFIILIVVLSCLAIPTQQKSFLMSGQKLSVGECLESCNARYKICFTEDGNLVSTDNEVGTLWTSGSTNNVSTSVTMQTTGNLEMRDAEGGLIWESRTANNPGSYMRMRNDGNAAIYTVESTCNSATEGEDKLVVIWVSGRN